MTTEDFWKVYLERDILEVFDIIYDFFSKELPRDFIENYDVGEVILETFGHYNEAKRFDEVLKFCELLQKKQPKLYEEYFQYLDDFLIDYYCFQNNQSKVVELFSHFIANPLQDFDQYLLSFRRLLFFGYTNILNEAIVKNFKEVATSDKLMENAGYDLAISKFYITIEELYQEDNTTGFDSEKIIKILSEYGFDFNDKLISAVEIGLQKQICKEDIITAFINDRTNFIITLEIYFLKYMQERKFSFALSGRLWDKILAFWEENNKNKKSKPDNYFKITLKKFEEYIAKLSVSMFIDNTSEMIAVLWGSLYIYDFLKSIEIISQKTFDDFEEILNVVKGIVIGQFTSDLWNSNFIHAWEKPQSMSTVEFIEEEKIFKKSFLLKNKKFNKLRSEISEELENIGSLSEYIIEGGKTVESKKTVSIHDDFFATNNDVSYDNYETTEPIRVEKKVGRNEPCPCGSGKKYKRCCG